jgi:hypothetical protein
MKPLNPEVHGQATALLPGMLIPHMTTIGIAIFCVHHKSLQGIRISGAIPPTLPNAILDVEQTPTGGD